MLNRVSDLFWSPKSSIALAPNPSEQILTTSGDTIKIDFFENVGNARRRSSFLPQNWKEKEPQLRLPSRSRFVYKGATVINRNDAVHAKLFCTNSKYAGNFNSLGMAGKGIYKYPHGVIYDGNFNKRGEFHGNGTLIYPSGQKVEGFWKNGRLVKGANFIARDDTILNDSTCKSDRRFQIEVVNELMPAGVEYLTSDRTPRRIPKDCYDTGEGFFDPKRRIILDYNDQNSRKSLVISDIYKGEKQFIYNVLSECKSSLHLLYHLYTRSVPRMQTITVGPCEEIEHWIKMNCRKAWDEPTEYQPDLYEVWTAGYKYDHLFDIVSTNSENNIIERFSQITSSLAKDSRMYTFIKSKKRKCRSDSVSNLACILTLLGQRAGKLRYSKNTVLSDALSTGTAAPVFPKIKHLLHSTHIPTKAILISNIKSS